MRPKIHRRDIRGDFERIKTLDEGAGGAGPGALNGGVYVVKRKADGVRCVEKRIPTSEVHVDSILTRELVTLRSLEHPNITQYVDAFISLQSTPPAAALYMEYCDLGSLEDMVEKYRQQRRQQQHAGNNNNNNHSSRSGLPIPESFIWHAFHCLLKALAYMHSGIADVNSFCLPVPGWQTVLHRDIKPANVFVKTADRGGRYPSIVLGDFGIATRQGDVEWGEMQVCGTFAWQPPELPEHDLQGKGDVWAVGAVVQSMCRLDEGPVGNPPPGVSVDAWERDPRARRPKTAGSTYSAQLNEALALALKRKKFERPTAATLLLELKDLFRESKTTFASLPGWVFGG
ncbi:MAG: hypothetical protein M1816_001211 [Peltula sp. TS41687]|nr:MAG: hypothetical protein M1816_001211 [Peltula sp. TS41687]